MDFGDLRIAMTEDSKPSLKKTATKTSCVVLQAATEKDLLSDVQSVVVSQCPRDSAPERSWNPPKFDELSDPGW